MIAIGCARPSLSSNRLLARLPVDDYQRLLPSLRTLSLDPRHVLLKPDVRSDLVYFLEGGLCSISQGTADGQLAGVALVGKEGVIGIPEFGGDPQSGVTATVEIAEGRAQVLPMDTFRREMERREALHDLVDRYIRAFTSSLMQSVVCNALHPVEKRHARCLLEIRDRLDRNEFTLTQSALAGMLGVRRATVTLCASHLHRCGTIEHRHKRTAILDPARLEQAACECYRVVKSHFARLLG